MIEGELALFLLQGSSSADDYPDFQPGSTCGEVKGSPVFGRGAQLAPYSAAHNPFLLRRKESSSKFSLTTLEADRMSDPLKR